MGMRVVERRHEQLARPVVSLAVFGSIGRLCIADVVDNAIKHTDPLMLAVIQVLVDECNVREQHAPSPFVDMLT